MVIVYILVWTSLCQPLLKVKYYYYHLGITDMPKFISDSKEFLQGVMLTPVKSPEMFDRNLLSVSPYFKNC